MYFEINRQDLVNHTDRMLVSLESAQGTTPTYMATTEAIPSALGVIHYGNDAYSAGVCPNADSTFSGIRLSYSTPLPTP